MTGTEVTLTDTLPTEVSFVSSTSSQGVCIGTSTVTCSLGALGSGDDATVTIIVTATAVGAITNTASVVGKEADPDTGDNTVSEANTINEAADLSVTKTDSDDPVLVGSSLTYTVVVTNDGPSTGTEVTLTDTLPGNVTFVSSTPSQGGCNGTSTVTCNLGTLASGDDATVTIVVITNTTSVTSGVSDPLARNNSSSQSTTVTTPSQADLSVTKVDVPDPVFVGEPLVYTVTVDNNGPQQATEVRLRQ